MLTEEGLRRVLDEKLVDLNKNMKEVRRDMENLRKEMRRDMEDMDRRIRINASAPSFTVSDSTRPSVVFAGSVSRPLWGKRSHYG